MGGKAKAWGVGLGLTALAALTGGAAAALVPGGLGFLGGAGVGAAAGALSGTNAGMETYKGQQQERVQEKANRQAEAVAAREAGNTPEATNQNNDLSDIIKRKSAMRRAIFTASSSESKKLGD